MKYRFLFCQLLVARKSLVRWTVVLGCIAALAVPASAQYNGGAPWGQDKDPSEFAQITNSYRTVVNGDIVHYRYDVFVGPGQFDVIRIHRVVREKKPFQPIPTVEGVFLLPGSPNLFEFIFMAPSLSPAVPWDQSIAAFLAKNDIDVWGIDYGWLLIPPGTTDFGFLKGWGVQKDAEHTEIALSIARRIRTLTGQGFGRFHLLGFSYGLFLAYAVAGEESQMPPGHRNVKSIIPVDSPMKVFTESSRLSSCKNALNYQAQIAAGVYRIEGSKEIYELAESDPDGPSPIYPGLTNLQAVMKRLTGFCTSELDASGNPVSLKYSNINMIVDAGLANSVDTTMQASFEIAACRCEDPLVADVNWDDHLGEITIPILSITRAKLGDRAATLTASDDITVLIVLPPDFPDFGHADMFFAGLAETKIWTPILDWILAHRSNGND